MRLKLEKEQPRSPASPTRFKGGVWTCCVTRPLKSGPSQLLCTFGERRTIHRKCQAPPTSRAERKERQTYRQNVRCQMAKPLRSPGHVGILAVDLPPMARTAIAFGLFIVYLDVIGSS